MKRATLWLFVLVAAVTVAVGSLFVSTPVDAQGKRPLKATLQPFEEVPAVSSVAGGEFRARISGDETAIEYELSYSGLEGDVAQAHIHFGQMGVNGGISVWLCGTAALPGPAGTPTCPAEGTVSRTVTAADVIGPAGQGIAAMEFAELVDALRGGVAYANVHSSKFPGGEIRGQIK